MARSARVPASMMDLFDVAEGRVARMFEQLDRDPERGQVQVAGERYLLMRAESFYLGILEGLQESAGEEHAPRLLYATARAMGRRDARTFAQRDGLAPGVERLACGPVHFAHAGFASVHILGTSRPTADENCFLHYEHPNTFETSVLRMQGRTGTECVCHFSAGYSAGWTTEAFGLELHARELLCVGRGEVHCEFIMAPADRLDGHELKVRGSWMRT